LINRALNAWGLAGQLTSKREVRGATVLLLAGDVDGNLGDRAILQATCDGLRSVAPGATIVVVSAEPANRRRDCGAEILRPGLRGLVPLCRAALRSDVVLIGGGGLFQDDDSLVKMPYWALRVAMVRLWARRVIGYSLGVGPLRAASSRIFARLAFACMNDVTVRDPRARAVAQALTAHTVRVLPDPATALCPLSGAAARAWLHAQGVPIEGSPLLGVSLRRWFPPGHRIVPHKIAWRLGLSDPCGGKEGPDFADLLALVLDRQVERHGAYILFLPSYLRPHEGDDVLAEAVLARLRRPNGRVVRIDDPRLYKACTGELRALLGGRMHPMILASAMGTPVVALAYNPKFAGFLELLGSAEGLIDVETFVRERRVKELDAMLDAAMGAPRLPLESTKHLAAEVREFHRDLLGRLE